MTNTKACYKLIADHMICIYGRIDRSRLLTFAAGVRTGDIMKKKITTVVMGAVLSLAVLAGCNGTAGGTQEGRGLIKDSPRVTVVAEATPAPTPADQPTPAPAVDDGTIYVDNVADLIEAIAPGAKIVLKPGTYNISDYIGQICSKDPEVWNRNHRYVEIREVYDGAELVIKDVEGLDLRGESDDRADTEVITDPRYAAVMRFEFCDELLLSGFTMGHTMTGMCVGNVVDLISCDSVIVDNMDLYGCGVTGLNLEYCSTFLRCSDTTIRDCSWGPLNDYNSRGEWKFYDCVFSGSDGGGYFPESKTLDIYFENCTFGDMETENFMFRDDITTKNCTWGDLSNITYPDYGDPGVPTEFHTDNLSVASFDGKMLSDWHWTGFTVTDEDSGEIEPLYMWLSFYDDGTGLLSDVYSDQTFTWYMDSQYSAALTMDDGSGEYSVIIYTDSNDTETTMWMQLIQDGNGTWFF